MLTSTSTSPQSLREIWKEVVLKRNRTPQSVRAEILQSWQRCLEWGVNPHQPTVPEFLDCEKLRERRTANQELLDVAFPVLQGIEGFANTLNFIVTLSDNLGYVLELIGNEGVAHSVEKGNYKPGSKWSENIAGTNAIGTSILTKQPIQISTYEHYCVCSHDWECAGAPIKNPVTEEVIGVVSMTCHYSNPYRHLLAIVSETASAIENKLAYRNAEILCQIASAQKIAIADSVKEGILILDRGGYITHANKNCCQILGLSEERLLHQNISKVLGAQNSCLIDLLTHEQNNTVQQITLYNPLTRNRCRHDIIISPVKTERRGYCGKIVLLGKTEKVQKQEPQPLDSQAGFNFEDLIGDSPCFLRSIEEARCAAESLSNVLLVGESGTGKEMFAQAIHNASPRRNGPFLAINCSGIPRELIGSELFGYDHGAFTGAKKGGSPGKFILADGGTLFLDEIGDMPLELQPILLRVLEDKKIMKLGSSKLVPVDVRVIAASNKNIWEEVGRGNFRNDLFYRLNVLTISLPPLRKRKDDIAGLIHYFLDRLTRKYNKGIYDIQPEIMDIFKDYNWPGNVRQLQNALERMVILASDRTITIDLLPPEIVKQSSGPEKEFSTLENSEKQIISQVLKTYDYNISQASQNLGVARTTLYRKIEKYGLNRGN